MTHKYLSGIGHFSDDGKIETEYGKILRIYDCKIVLILNNLPINGKNQEGKCIYIPIDEDDNRFYNNSDFRHAEYMKHTLIDRYSFGDEKNEIHNSLQKSAEDLGYNELYESFIRNGIMVFSNLDYSIDEPRIKNGALFLPNELRNSQIEQISLMQKELKTEGYIIGLFRLLNTKSRSAIVHIKDIFPDIILEEIKGFQENKKANENEER